MPVTLKPGYKTTELAVTVAFNLAVLISAAASWLPPRYAALAGSAATGLYAISRGLAKLNPPKAVEPVGAPAQSTTVTPPAA